MKATVIVLWLALATGVGVSMFLLKYKVQALEDELIAKQEQVLRDRSAIRVLQAEWTYLNDPERLRQLSAEHLGFGPPDIGNIAALDMVPLRGATAPAADAPAGTLPIKGIQPQIETQLRMPPASTPRSPSVVSASIARLQRLLFPTAAGATTQAGAQP